MKSKVYFSNNITPENVVNLYDKVGVSLPGKIAVKVHSGEKGNQNFLRPEFLKEIVEHVKGTVVECNTAYPGARNTTKKHTALMETHGWSKVFNVDILDADEDMELTIPDGKILKKNYVGKNMTNYDSALVISHFKGHPMGGYGGALKQLGIGFASKKGKRYVHCCGKEKGTYADMFLVKQEKFLESMADAAKSIIDYFKGNIVYINIMCNMSVDCDCCATAKDPCMGDIGILASLDPVALDQACIDLVYNATDPGKQHLIKRIEDKKGIHTIEAAADLKIGSREYELINVD